MQDAIPVFMQYGAMGILALAFVIILLLFYRADKRAQTYANSLSEASFDRSKLIDVVVENTKASTAMLSVMNRALDVMDKLERRLTLEHCPLLKPESEIKKPESRRTR